MNSRGGAGKLFMSLLGKERERERERLLCEYLCEAKYMKIQASFFKKMNEEIKK